MITNIRFLLFLWRWHGRDANCRFIFLDFGAYGQQSDGGIFAASSFGKAICTPASLHVFQTDDDLIPEAEDLGRIPYVIVADEAFPLKHIQIKEQRLSRMRTVIGMAGLEGLLKMLSLFWHRNRECQPTVPELLSNPNRVIKIVQATTVLYNMMQQQRPCVNNETLQAADDFAMDAVRKQQVCSF